MIDDIFVIDPVVHTFNLSPANVRDHQAARLLADGLASLHRVQPPHIERLPEAIVRSDPSVDLLAETLFMETDVDMGGFHTLRFDSWFHDGVAPSSKTREATTKYPDRFVAYVGVEPTQGLEACLRDLDEQLATTPNAVGIKCYPVQSAPVRGYRMDDRDLVFPLIERAAEAGVKTVAVHKLWAFPMMPTSPYRLDDVDAVALAFPDLSFEIIHSGMAFVEETALLVGRYPNVYANLEGTPTLGCMAPRLFEEAMATFVRAAGVEKIIYSDGGTLLLHSQPLLENFVSFQFSDETCSGLGVRELTKADKALMLGGNYARLIGLDIEAAKARIADDDFARRRQVEGRRRAYDTWRTAAAHA